MLHSKSLLVIVLVSSSLCYGRTQGKTAESAGDCAIGFNEIQIYSLILNYLHSLSPTPTVVNPRTERTNAIWRLQEIDLNEFGKADLLSYGDRGRKFYDISDGFSGLTAESKKDLDRAAEKRFDQVCKIDWKNSDQSLVVNSANPEDGEKFDMEHPGEISASFSRVAFDPKRRYALVGMRTYSSRSELSSVYLLERRGKVWIIRREFPTGMS